MPGETPREVRLRRGIERDGEHLRGMWTHTWMPEEDAYVREQQPHLRADLVVAGWASDVAPDGYTPA
jgi:hypothetical protein